MNVELGKPDTSIFSPEEGEPKPKAVRKSGLLFVHRTETTAMTTDQKIERFFEAHPWAMFPAAAVTVAAGWAALYILFYFTPGL